jgi:IclR family transcriptional regulator, acetate operon repressor
MGETTAIADKSPVTKALRLLACVSGSREPIALADLSRSIGLPKPTTFRLLRSLENVGFVQRDPLTRRHVIGSLFEDVALNALRHSAGHGRRRLLLGGLARKMGARINLVVLKSANVLFVEWVESMTPLRVDIDPATAMPVHCTASGKLLLAFGPTELRESVLRSAPFPACTKNSITTARSLRRELEEICRRGHSEDDEELLLGVNCIAVPVHNRSGHVVAGLAAMAPVASLPLDRLRRSLPDLRECASSISHELGGALQASSSNGEPPRPPAAKPRLRGRSSKKSRTEDGGGGSVHSRASRQPRSRRRRARVGPFDDQ